MPSQKKIPEKTSSQILILSHLINHFQRYVTLFAGCTRCMHGTVSHEKCMRFAFPLHSWWSWCGQTQTVAPFQGPKKTDKQLPMLKTNLFSIVLGSLPNCCFGMNWAAFAPTCLDLDDTYIIFQYDILMSPSKKRSFEREFFIKALSAFGGVLGELQAGVCSVRFYSDGSVGRFASPLQFRKNRIGFGCCSKWICAINQMTQKMTTDCW